MQAKAAKNYALSNVQTQNKMGADISASAHCTCLKFRYPKAFRFTLVSGCFN